MENLRLQLGKPEKKNHNVGRHLIVYKGSMVIDVWFGDIFAIKTPEEAEQIANKIIEALKDN
jgi:hypothetical protein